MRGPQPYDRHTGPVRVTVSQDGANMHDYIHGCTVECQQGCLPDRTVLTMSVEEMRDLRYLLDRAIAHAEGL